MICCKCNCEGNSTFTPVAVGYLTCWSKRQNEAFWPWYYKMDVVQYHFIEFRSKFSWIQILSRYLACLVGNADISQLKKICTVFISRSITPKPWWVHCSGRVQGFHHIFCHCSVTFINCILTHFSFTCEGKQSWLLTGGLYDVCIFQNNTVEKILTVLSVNINNIYCQFIDLSINKSMIFLCVHLNLPEGKTVGQPQITESASFMVIVKHLCVEFGKQNHCEITPCLLEKPLLTPLAFWPS